MIDEKRYVVKTRWGTFSLDEASYYEYLEGKLWICWSPVKQQQKECIKPAMVSKEADELRNLAQSEPYLLMISRFPDKTKYPYSEKLKFESIDEICLSVRSSNALKRAGILNFSQLNAKINTEEGLLSIRNLGIKSQYEIKKCFFDICYNMLSMNEKGMFWQNMIETQIEE